jgi:hypothetical protein
MRGPPYNTIRAWAAVMTMPSGVSDGMNAGRAGGLALRPTMASRLVVLETAGEMPGMIEFFDAAGRLVRRTQIAAADRAAHTCAIDVNDITPGVYVARVLPAGWTRRFVVVR